MASEQRDHLFLAFQFQNSEISRATHRNKLTPTASDNVSKLGGEQSVEQTKTQVAKKHQKNTAALCEEVIPPVRDGETPTERGSGAFSQALLGALNALDGSSVAVPLTCGTPCNVVEQLCENLLPDAVGAVQ